MTEVNSNPESVLGDLAALPIWAARGAPAGVVASKRAPINPRTGRLAKNDTPTTWAARAKAVKRAAHYPAEREPGVGLMLGEAHAPEGWVRAGLDLDGCRVPRTGDLEPWAREIAHRFDTLTESSPSGTGLHLLFYARAADVATLRAEGLIEKVGRSFSRGGHVEIAAFFGGKFMAVTDDFLPLGDDPLLGDLDTIRAVSLANLRWLLAEYGPEWAGAGDGPGVAGLGDESGSGHAFRLALDLAREGLAPEEIAERIAADEGDAGEWWRARPTGSATAR